MIASALRRALLTAAALAAAAPALSSTVAVDVLPPGSSVDGQGYPELAQSWWRWVFRARDGMRPTQDPTGAQCHVGQAGNTWFLAGTHGTGPVVRRCTVPQGRHLFLPVWVQLEYSVPGRRRDCDALRKAAAAGVDSLATMQVELDGVRLAPVRGNSRDCFDAYADAEHNDPPPGLYAPAFTDGYWLLIPPLPAGQHQLRVEARQQTESGLPGRFDQQFTYELQVGPAPDEPDDGVGATEEDRESIRL